MSLFRQIRMVGLGQLVKILTQLISIFYLTQLINPEDFGLIAMAAIVMNLAFLFNDLGLSSAIIQKQDISLSFYNLIYKINMIVGFTMMFIVIIISPLISNYFSQPKLVFILFLLSLSFPIMALSTVHKASIEKDQNFKITTNIEIFSSIIALSIAVVLAHSKLGVYSLVLQTLTFTIISSMLYRHHSKINVKIQANSTDKKNSKDLLSFSSNIFLFNLVNYFTRNLDSLLIGKFFSAAILGSYSIAYKIMLFPVQNITSIITRVFLPHFSKNLDNIAQNRKTYFKSLKYITMITAPLMLGLASVSYEFTDLFLRKEWFIIGDILIWLAPTAILQAVISTTGTIFIAYAKTFWLFTLGIIGAILTSTAFGLGVFYDIKTLVLFYFISNIINFFPCFYLAGKILKFNVIYALFFILKYTIPAIIMFVSLNFISLEINFKNTTQSFLIKILIGIIIFTISFITLNKKEIILLKNNIVKK